MDSMMEVALKLVEMGKPVIPVNRETKRPIIQWREYQKTLPTREEAESWFGSDDVNIGLITGRLSGYVVIDCDSKEAIESFLERYPDANNTLQIQTGRGRHFYFQYEEGIRNDTGKLLGPGIDIRGEGGFVVVPPSVHANGTPYEWLNRNKPIPLNGQLKKVLTGSGTKIQSDNADQLQEGNEKIPEGERNNALTSLAGSMRDKGMGEEAIAAALLAENKAKCEPPLDQKEVTNIAKSIAQYEPGSVLINQKGKTSIPSELKNKIIHPALHIEPGFASIGVINRIEGKLKFLVLTSNEGIYEAKEIQDVLTTKPLLHPNLEGRWRQSDKVLSISESILLLMNKIQELVCFEDKRWYSVISLWCAGTYLFLVFPAFPYLQLTGEKGSGKTKVQDILECTAFNALKLVDPTPAVLFRMVQPLRPTLLIDEAEGMNSEDARAIKSILNAGYKAGGTVARIEGDDHQPHFYEVYSPKSLSSIRSLGSVMEDRCISIVMARAPGDDIRQNKSVDPRDQDWVKIRAAFYQFPLKYSDRILEGLNRMSFPHWLLARDRELWAPILQLASLLDDESDSRLFADVLGLAQESTKDRGMEFETEAVITILETRLDGQTSIKIHPGDILKELEGILNSKVHPVSVARKLRNLGFKSPGRDRAGVIYEIEASRLMEIKARYSL